MAAKKSRASAASNVSTPSEIAPGIFVGSWKDAETFEGSRFCVLDEMPSDAPADEGVTIYDEESRSPIVANLDRVVRLMETAHGRHRPVLVFCGHGVRRSPLAGAWYLHRVEGVELEDAYRRLRSVRPQTEHAKDWAGHWEVLLEGDRPKPAPAARR
jgi:hypothetical protein